MSPAVGNNSSGTRVLFIGQSLNLVPNGNTYPMQLMNGSFPKVPYTNSAIGGAAWNGLVKVRNYMVLPWVAVSGYTVLIMNGGTTDLAVGATGADCYAGMGEFSTWAKANGFDWIIGTTITPSTTFTGPQETQRLAGNTLILADASNYFDSEADLMSDSRLTNPADTTYYADGTHFTATGAGVAASVVQPVLASVLAAHP